MDLERARHELFAVAPARFVAERDRLARELAADGRKQEAAALRALRRPSATLWALNQAARQEPGLIDQVLDAGARMVELHRQLARGGAAGDFRSDAVAYRRAVGSAAAAAEKVLEAAGHAVDPAALRKLEQTLEALPFASPEQRGQARAGQLAEEPARPDVFDAASLAAAPPASAQRRAPTAKPPRREDRDPGRARGAAQQRRQAEADLKARRAAAGKARQVADRAAKLVARAETELAAARARAESARQALRGAEAELAAREDRLAEARQAADEARQAADQARLAAAEAASRAASDAR
jgi:hypothetical protein